MCIRDRLKPLGEIENSTFLLPPQPVARPSTKTDTVTTQMRTENLILPPHSRILFQPPFRIAGFGRDGERRRVESEPAETGVRTRPAPEPGYSEADVS